VRNFLEQIVSSEELLPDLIWFPCFETRSYFAWNAFIQEATLNALRSELWGYVRGGGRGFN